MTIQIDSREKPKAIKNIVDEFDKQGVTHFVSKLPCGDYMSLDNARFAIDRKQNLLEVCSNVCQEHTRFINELKRANEFGIRIVFLIEHSRNIRSLDDVQKWKKPRPKEPTFGVQAERLYKIIQKSEKSDNTKL